LEEIQTEVLRVFLLAFRSHRYSFALRFIFLQIPATSNTVSRVQLLCTIKEKGGILDRKPSLWLRNPYRNLKSENSQDYAQKPQRNCTFMNSASGHQKDYQINASCTNSTRVLNITSAPQSRDTSFRDASSGGQNIHSRTSKADNSGPHRTGTHRPVSQNDHYNMWCRCRVLGFLSSFSKLGPPCTPSPACEGVPTPLVPGSEHSLAGEGVEGFHEGTDTVVL
jgi:hypothetical protein